MKMLNAAIVSAVLTLGIAGNSMAAPSKAEQPQQKVTQVKQQAAQKASKKVVAKTYKVRKGDTIFSIAKKNNVSVSAIIKLNKLWGNKVQNLKVGSIIRLS
ncbi:LysM peptidoglycan-binding domain-containing protein [Leucothrix sargassi]|nr:LysM peptidoglycan-binding domain-containing protein [Leucothrix sargassi]